MSPRPEYFHSIKHILCRYSLPFLYLYYQGGVPSTPAPGHPFQRPCFKGRSLVLRSLCPGASISAHITQLIGSAQLAVVENINRPGREVVLSLTVSLKHFTVENFFFTPRTNKSRFARISHIHNSSQLTNSQKVPAATATFACVFKQCLFQFETVVFESFFFSSWPLFQLKIFI